VNIAPTTYYEAGGDIPISINFTPYVGGDFIVQLVIGPDFSDADNSNNKATRVLGVNSPPVADAGPDLTVRSSELSTLVVNGYGHDADGDPLIYRWLEDINELLGWDNIGANGLSYLDLSTVPYFSIGEHTLTLEISDGNFTTSDDMTLTVENSEPHIAPIGGGVYEVFSNVALNGQVLDFDGDTLEYEWLEGTNTLFSGSVKTNYGDEPVSLPEHIISNLSLGVHTLTIKVNDGNNDPVQSDIIVDIVDSTVPTLAPVPNKTILWPPNHKMVEISIEANATDNFGNVTISATISSNEPDDGLGDGDKAPDWTEPVIDQNNGIITFQLRAERSGLGNGRVYSIHIKATDESNNSSNAEVEIVVPHDKKK